MILNLDGFELEIHRDSFVCVDDGAKVHFCEWGLLDGNLQSAFRTIQEELALIAERFIISGNKVAFDAIAEEYPVNGIESCT